jgi:hypothetical protein
MTVQASAKSIQRYTKQKLSAFFYWISFLVSLFKIALFVRCVFYDGDFV